MLEESIELSIEKLAGLGDGLGMHEGHKVYVPRTLPGDVVKAHIVKETSDASYATLEQIITPSPDRAEAVCKHFDACGGCSLQHMKQEHYRKFKQTMAEEAVRKAGFDTSVVEPMVALPPASRRRVELKVEQGRLGYFTEGSHRLVDIEECKVLEPSLLTLVMQIKEQVVNLDHISGVQINGVDDGYDVVLIQRSNAKTELKRLPQIKRLSVKNREKVTTLWQTGPVIVTLGDVKVEVPPGAFLQASKEAQTLMTERVVSAVSGAANVLDLFCGVGTYSFPLAAHARVTAVEGETSMVNAMRSGITKAELTKKIEVKRRDLFRDPFTHYMFASFDAVVINPPRMGAKAQSEQLAKARVPKLVMVSCNPATFTRDARLLREGGYKLTRVLPVDQFVFSSHLELVAEFS